MIKLLVDKRYTDVAKEKWGSEFEIVPSFKTQADEPVSCHPDMSFVGIKGTYVCEKTAYEYYKKILPDSNLICGETAIKRNYPNDIAYNVLISENMAIANFKHTDSVVKSVIERENIKMINTNQGYAKCAACVFANSIITEDESILKSAHGTDLRVLKINKGEVALRGYDCGFIGGTTGYAKGKLLFFGDITKHSDFDKILRFLNENNTEFDYIKDYPLTDVGTIIGIEK